jgi:sarcosine oxidase subunit beta
MVDVVVIGAGISGAATAYNLARDGFSVTLVDRFGPAAMASGWTLAGVRQSGRHPAELPLARAAVAIWQNLAEELGGETHYRRSGNLRIARTPAEAEIIREVVREQSAAGLDITLLADNAAVREVAPALSERVLLASHCTSDGSADPVSTVQSFVAAAERLGAVCRFGEKVLRIEAQAGKATAVVTDQRRIPTERVVIAAGIFGNALLEPFGIRIPLEIPMVTVVRSAPGPRVVDQVVSTAVANCTGRQQHDGRWRVTNGAEPWHGGLSETVEADGRIVPRVLPLAGAIGDVVSRFSEIVPAFREAQIEQVWAGLLDLTPDALPVLDAVPGCEGAILAMGFSGHGFCLGPITGRILADLVRGKISDLPLDPFQIGRFQSLRAVPQPATLHG